MNFISPVSSARLFMLLLTVLIPTEAFAYIDPNSGGLLFQLLAPLFAACLGAWVFMRQAISRFLRELWQKLRGRNDQ